MRKNEHSKREPASALTIRENVNAFNVTRFPEVQPLPGRVNRLTVREEEVLDLAAGLSNPDIGLALGISINTVKAHLTNIYKKLNVERRSQAVLLFHDKRCQEIGGKAA